MVLVGASSLDELFERYMIESKVFKDRDKLLPDYVPNELPHRSNQVMQLAKILAPALASSRPSNVFIYGLTGTGKTAVAKYVLRKLEERAQDRVLFSYVNCRQNDTNYRVMSELARGLGTRIPFTGLSTSEVYKRFVSSLDRRGRVMVVVLDEIDHLVKKSGDDVLYFLTRINEQLSSSKLSLIGITNDLKFTEFLDARVKSSLGEEELVFPPYSARELEDILRQRAAEAFNEGALAPDVIPLCAAIAAKQNGDARLALDLLLKAADIAERVGAERVIADHVRQAQREIEKNVTVDVIKSMPLHVKLVLLAIYLLERDGARNITTGMIYNRYVEITKLLGIDAVTQRRVSDIINELDMSGIVNARVVSLGRYGRTKVIRLSTSLRNIEEGLQEDLFLLGVTEMVTR